MDDDSGALAQLGERFHGMEEVIGSIPLGSTITLPGSFAGTASSERPTPRHHRSLRRTGIPTVGAVTALAVRRGLAPAPVHPRGCSPERGRRSPPRAALHRGCSPRGGADRGGTPRRARCRPAGACPGPGPRRCPATRCPPRPGARVRGRGCRRRSAASRGREVRCRSSRRSALVRVARGAAADDGGGRPRCRPCRRQDIQVTCLRVFGVSGCRRRNRRVARMGDAACLV